MHFGCLNTIMRLEMQFRTHIRKQRQSREFNKAENSAKNFDLESKRIQTESGATSIIEFQFLIEFEEIYFLIELINCHLPTCYLWFSHCLSSEHRDSNRIVRLVSDETWLINKKLPDK